MKTFPLALLYPPLYRLFTLGTEPKAGNSLDWYAAENQIWIQHGDVEDIREQLKQEFPEYFSEYDSYGQQKPIEAEEGVWVAWQVAVPDSYVQPVQLHWTAILQDTFDVAAGKVKGKTAADVAAMQRLIRDRLANPDGDRWHAWKEEKPATAPLKSRIFVHVRGANGKSFQTPGDGATLREVKGTWSIPG